MQFHGIPIISFITFVVRSRMHRRSYPKPRRSKTQLNPAPELWLLCESTAVALLFVWCCQAPALWVLMGWYLGCRATARPLRFKQAPSVCSVLRFVLLLPSGRFTEMGMEPVYELESLIPQGPHRPSAASRGAVLGGCLGTTAGQGSQAS